MGVEPKRGGKRRVSDSEEEDAMAKAMILLSSTDDEEANQDLSLEIIERAKRRKEAHGAEKSGKKNSSEPVKDGNGAVKKPLSGVAVVDVLLSSDDAERSMKKMKKKNRRKKKKEVKEGDDLVVAEPKVVDGDAAVHEEEPVVVGESVITEVNEAPDNMVLKKLLRGPRYFDSKGCNWHFCHNCNEEGHTAANCKSEKRQKPCFVCGMVGHNPWKCTQGCSVCKRRGHATKDCPRKEKKSSQNSKICLRCGDSGHDMFICSYTFAPEDLKEIQCYVCKKFGHLCCVDVLDIGPKVVSCYNCGQHGHSGVGCAKQRFQTRNADSPTLCYKCGEEGHFARGCTNKTKIVQPDRWMDEKTTPIPKVKRKGGFADSRSAPNDLGKVRKKKNIQYEERSMTARKSRIKGGWIVDDPGDLPCEKYYTNRWRTYPSISGKKGWTSSVNQYSSPRSSHKSPRPFPRTPSSSGSAGHYRRAHSGTYRPARNGHYRPAHGASRFGDSGGYY